MEPKQELKAGTEAGTMGEKMLFTGWLALARQATFLILPRPRNGTAQSSLAPSTSGSSQEDTLQLCSQTSQMKAIPQMKECQVDH